MPARPAAAARSRVPLFLTVIFGAVVLTTLGAWYFFLRSPAPPAVPPRPVATVRPTPAPPPTTLAALPTPAPGVAPSGTATATPGAVPTPAATAVPTPTPVPTPGARPTPTPVPTPAARPTPAATPPPAAAAGDARALLAQGSLSEAARAFATSLRPNARGRFTLQVLVACAPENVQKAVSAVPAQELLVLPVDLKGRACYRLCWGVYDSRPAAEAALGSLPSYFRQAGAAPRLSPLAELVP